MRTQGIETESFTFHRKHANMMKLCKNDFTQNRVSDKHETLVRFTGE